jgi:hypothetical protein
MTTTIRPMRPPDALIDRVATLEVQVRALEAAEQQRRLARLRPGDARRLSRLLSVVAPLLGLDAFMAEYLWSVQDANVRLVLRDLSIKQIGRLLARGEGIEFDGYRLVAAGRIDKCRQWIVERSL